MKKYVFRGLIILIGLAFVSISVALAHGTPVVAVQPTVAPAGGQITVTGSEMEAGETFTITLEGPSGSIFLGTITATGAKQESATDQEQNKVTPESDAKATPGSGAATSDEAEQGGFTVAYTIPDKTPPGPYTMRATAEDGDATDTDLTITAASAQALPSASWPSHRCATPRSDKAWASAVLSPACRLTRRLFTYSLRAARQSPVRKVNQPRECRARARRAEAESPPSSSKRPSHRWARPKWPRLYQNQLSASAICIAASVRP